MRKHTVVYWILQILCLIAGVLLCYVLPVYVNEITLSALLLLFGIVGASGAIETYLVNKYDKVDGDLIAGLEDEDGLVFSLDTPVEELVKKDKVTFNVLRKQMVVKKEDN